MKHLVDELGAVSEQIRTLTKQAEALKSILKDSAFLQDTATIEGFAYTATITARAQPDRIDRKRLFATHARNDLIEQGIVSTSEPTLVITTTPIPSIALLKKGA
jgi:hypothetical protein